MKLPDVHQAVLDDETLHAYFRDLEHAATILEVRVKATNALRANEGVHDLLRARVLFEGKDIAGMQVRYLFDEKEWLDTLSWGPAGARLVRIAHEFSEDE